MLFFFFLHLIHLPSYHFKVFCAQHIDASFNLYQGPYFHKTKTHLQRVVGDENLLVVKFAEEVADRRRRYNLSYDHYCKIAREGIQVGNRRYYFFGELSFK